ncbi:MAG: hypothetical protein ACYTXA_20225 [Nostoc sp.]
MGSLTGIGIWGSGKFGLSLEAGVRLWCAIGSKLCRSFLTKLTRLIAEMDWFYFGLKFFV